MTNTEWLKKFNEDCDRIRETIYDEGVVEKMKKHVTEEILDSIRGSTNALAKEIQETKERLGPIEDSLVKLNAMSEASSDGTTTAASDSVVSKEFRRLLEASEIILDAQSTVVVPAVGEKPRQTNYLDAKIEKPKVGYVSAAP